MGRKPPSHSIRTEPRCANLVSCRAVFVTKQSPVNLNTATLLSLKSSPPCRDDAETA
jgi:hypothetical protein